MIFHLILRNLINAMKSCREQLTQVEEALQSDVRSLELFKSADGEGRENAIALHMG